MNFFVFDIGGTKTRFALMDQDGDFLEGPFRENTQKENLVENLLKILRGYDDFDSVGISCCGIIDSDKGIIKYARNLCSCLNIKKELEESTGKRVFIGNDGDLAAMGEAFYGKGKKYSRIAYVGFGTGLAGGFCVNGKLPEKKDDYETEFGSIVLNGKKWKYVCSGSTMHEIYKNHNMVNGKKLDRRISSKEIFELASNGDEMAREFVEEVLGKYNSIGFSKIIKKFNPDYISVGGSIAMNNRGMIIEPVLKRLGDSIENIPKIEITSLGKDIGLYGSLSFCKTCHLKTNQTI